MDGEIVSNPVKFNVTQSPPSYLYYGNGQDWLMLSICPSPLLRPMTSGSGQAKLDSVSGKPSRNDS